jgi:hypothetical protein
LQHERRSARRLAIALEPPGNIARDISIYRRTLFKSSGEPSALAFPDLAFLSWNLPPEGTLTSRRSPGALGSALASCWIGVGGPFAEAGLAIAGGSLFLRLAGPLRLLTERAAAAAAGLGLSPAAAPPFEPGRGFFLRRTPGESGSEDLPIALEPPPFSFLDCSLALIRFDLGTDPFRAASWKVLARSRRRTGA